MHIFRGEHSVIDYSTLQTLSWRHTLSLGSPMWRQSDVANGRLQYRSFGGSSGCTRNHCNNGCSCHLKIDDLPNSVPRGGSVAVSLVLLWRSKNCMVHSLQSAADGQLLDRSFVVMEPEDTASSSGPHSNGSFPEPSCFHLHLRLIYFNIFFLSKPLSSK